MVKPPVEKGKEYNIHIESLGTSGEGVGRIDGFTVFVEGGLPGEDLFIRITEVKKNYAAADLLKIINASHDRVKPPCEIYRECGGCQLQHLSYEGQLMAKRQQVKDAMERIGHLKNLTVLPTIGAREPWNYRNKVAFPVGRDRGRTIIGCFAQGTHKIIDSSDCMIQDKINNEAISAVREVIDKLNIPVYDEDRHTGVIRHVVARTGEKGQLMVVLVTATKRLSREKEIIKLLRSRLPQMVSLQQNIQTYRNNVILGRETKLLWGRPTIKARLGKFSFNVSARSFFQVNTKQAEVLYDKALEFAQLTGKETVIDAYCGTGTISLYLAQKARKVYGVEIVSPAIKDAEKNARENKVKNAEFIVGDCTKVMPRLFKQGVRPDVIVVDPPRAGCTEVVLKTFANMKPNRIVYVSCNPATLARDLEILDKLGYKAEKVQPVDMFVASSHVESVALINRK
ncbi:23S rRNA (uracil(1939)-C(5))-methyltransferase RlmD [uncultured Anaerovibrio sp.]|uniref:23S rRNA (uracil(1939)-C(5))-methyltransferase RlmD n=1 Tax=uncultured Anaerovibrio sp. TaxID=361586 RepID=UPI002607EFBC|nr:23S rRNA (uracil(1939)-C(5))-methyltransferase RlmD [uncultured Anaerovibrio sp.]